MHYKAGMSVYNYFHLLDVHQHSKSLFSSSQKAELFQWVCVQLVSWCKLAGERELCEFSGHYEVQIPIHRTIGITFLTFVRSWIAANSILLGWIIKICQYCDSLGVITVASFSHQPWTFRTVIQSILTLGSEHWTIQYWILVSLPLLSKRPLLLSYNWYTCSSRLQFIIAYVVCTAVRCAVDGTIKFHRRRRSCFPTNILSRCTCMEAGTAILAAGMMGAW